MSGKFWGGVGPYQGGEGSPIGYLVRDDKDKWKNADTTTSRITGMSAAK